MNAASLNLWGETRKRTSTTTTLFCLFFLRKVLNVNLCSRKAWWVVTGTPLGDPCEFYLD